MANKTYTIYNPPKRYGIDVDTFIDDIDDVIERELQSFCEKRGCIVTRRYVCHRTDFTYYRAWVVFPDGTLRFVAYVWDRWRYR